MQMPIYPASVIITEGKITTELGRRHQEDLETFGIDDDYLTEFEDAVEEAEALPDDEYVVIQQKGSTRHKNVVLADCVDDVEDFRTRLGKGFGKDSHEYGSFPHSMLRRARKSESVMMELMETVVRLSEEYQEKLKPHGLTDAVLQNRKNLLKELQAADTVQEIKKVERPSATIERVEAHQLVYDLVNEVRECGRRVFKDQPEIYRLFKSPWGKYRSGRKSADEGDQPDAGDGRSDEERTGEE